MRYTYDGASLAGAKLMDEHDPGWYQHIDEPSLDMADPANCILGQRYGDFLTGARLFHLGLYGSRAYECGFDTRSCSSHHPYRLLKAAWLRRIHERQVAPAD